MSVSKLKEFANLPNLVDMFDQNELDEIALIVKRGCDEDEISMQEWISDIKKVEDLVDLKSTKKTTPLPDSANIKLPLITKACYEFAGRTVPEIIKDDQIIRIKPIGVNPDEYVKVCAQRAETFMNWQMLLRNTEWAEQLDMLLFRLAIVGFLCTKTYYDDVRKQITSEICDPDKLIIHVKTKTLSTAPRITHKVDWMLNTIIEKANVSKNKISIFCKEAVKEIQEMHKDEPLDSVIEGLEQCTYLDLDKDGYKEPYIITISTNPVKVLRIVAQYSKDSIFAAEEADKVAYIEKDDYYEDFHFLKNPKGHFQSVGFGILLLYMTETANSVMNQLVDAGQLSNMKGGFMDASFSPIKKGQTRHVPGEFQLIKTDPTKRMADGILPFSFSEPSSVLFQLLQLLISVCRDLTSSAEINNGTQSSENAKTGATLALQEEGRKSTTLINKSITRSLTKQFKNRFKLNNIYLTNKEYRAILNDNAADVSVDFNIVNVDVTPTADPNLASSQQKIQDLAILQSLMSLPGVNPIKITEKIIERLSIPGIKDVLLSDKDKQSAQPNPDMIKLQHDMEESAAKHQLEVEKLQLLKQDLAIKAKLAQANAILALAKAGSEEQKTKLNQFESDFATISKQMDMELGIANIMHEKDMQHNDHIQQAQSQLYDQQHQQNLQDSQNQTDTEMQSNQPEGPTDAPPAGTE